ncbi:MAG TPA: HK97 gp10 family phage protein, partial [Actinomycetota bacterium]|nr:HK97 gp10 family phage protein [Actinomycetota bacterium]
MATRMKWYADRVRRYTHTGPQAAHRIASVQAAGIAAQAVRSKGTGALARDVSRPRFVGFLRAVVGSTLPYARIQNFG